MTTKLMPHTHYIRWVFDERCDKSLLWRRMSQVTSLDLMFREVLCRKQNCREREREGKRRPSPTYFHFKYFSSLSRPRTGVEERITSQSCQLEWVSSTGSNDPGELHRMPVQFSFLIQKCNFLFPIPEKEPADWATFCLKFKFKCWMRAVKGLLTKEKCTVVIINRGIIGNIK